MDANIAVGILGIIIAVIFGIVNMWWASVLNKRQIQATLQNAQPDANINPTRKPRKKVFGFKQRRVLKGIRLMRLLILSMFIGTLSDAYRFYYLPRWPFIDTLMALTMIFVFASGTRALVMSRRLRHEIENGNRRMIDELYSAFTPRRAKPKLKP
jgi:hypothetical protein